MMGVHEELWKPCPDSHMPRPDVGFWEFTEGSQWSASRGEAGGGNSAPAWPPVREDEVAVRM